MSWYYAENNQQHGPVTETEFQNLVQGGKITPETLVWCDGMGAWQPYREVMPSPPTVGPVPPPVPLTQFAIPPGAASTISPQRDGPPWEHRESLGFFNAAIETIKGVLSEPSETFSRMRRDGGLAHPLQYALIVGGIGSYAACVYNVIAQVVQGIPSTFDKNAPVFHITQDTALFILLAAVFIIPLFLAISTFIKAGILHLCLMVVGGAKQPFETTYRVVCYSFGSASVLQLVPLCGGFAALIWDLVATCIGIARAHEISTGKAAVAVLLPMICCCGLGIAAFVLLFAAKAGTTFQH